MVGLTAAIIGSAVIGAGASAIGASKNSKAIKKSTDAQTAANDASIAQQRETYAQNKSILEPYSQRGNAAGEAINALLGLGGAAPQVGESALSGPEYNYGAMYSGGGAMANFLSEGNVATNDMDRLGANNFSAMQYGQPQAIPATQVQTTGQSALDKQRAAFDQFRASTGYQFRLNEGNKGLNSAYAGAGTLRSGAAAKAFERYNQDYASNEFGNYMGYLGNQQGVGLSAGSALAGVGQNYANNVTALNSNQANNISNAAVARANNTNSMIGGITSSFGNALGAYGQNAGWFNPGMSSSAANSGLGAIY